ncbi:tRNA lysidine(34) synthetase TilS [Methylobacterium sp. J-090]|uniref:tRNA lysidine(34) synthetase TilS n=1 Tax=Methylobacterium sp. J-090 TaxID=2836666 RepID=UPI001FB937A2|nr:tRNA lysidine(34) synthetase TilS [Methylobacterium sp. J-090]MCJ2083732.1 tRNA lysidine(34) synthetase TilS [Methylobacterium sp. J-090]
MTAPELDPAAIEAALIPYVAPALSHGGVVLAVSGGPDSTALMRAASRAGPTVPLHVVTVDHRLRTASVTEAGTVAAMARHLGLRHDILPWTGAKPANGLQAAARAVRYALLGRYAEDVGAQWVLTGHTRDDQAETVLMRLLAGSGPAGLAGMRTERALVGGVRLGRPFLGLPKAGLVAYCAAQGLVPIQDPTNLSPRFARARLRRLLPDLAEEGLTDARLCRLAARCARDDDALGQAAAAAYAAARRAADDPILIRLDGPTLAAVPDAILIRVVARALGEAACPGAAAPRLEKIEALVLTALRPALDTRTPLRRTLGGCLVSLTRGRGLTLAPAPARTGRAPRGDGLAAGARDLLGKGDGAAYIGPECPD